VTVARKHGPAVEKSDSSDLTTNYSNIISFEICTRTPAALAWRIGLVLRAIGSHPEQSRDEMAEDRFPLRLAHDAGHCGGYSVRRQPRSSTLQQAKSLFRVVGPKACILMHIGTE
jgi:hypothetical protein